MRRGSATSESTADPDARREAHAFCAKLRAAARDLKRALADSVHPVLSVGRRMSAMFTPSGGKLVDTVTFEADHARKQLLAEACEAVVAKLSMKMWREIAAGRGR